MKQGKVTSVNGMPLDDLIKIESRFGLEAVKSTTIYKSFSDIIVSDLRAGNIDDFLSKSSDEMAEAASDPQTQKKIQEILGAIGDDKRYTLTAGRDLIRDATSVGSDLSPAFLKGVGKSFIVISLGLAVFEANAAEEAGNPEAAKEIMIRWAVEESGSLLAEVGATVLVGVFTGVAVAAGVLSAPVAAALVLGAGLLGGFFGGDQALEYYNLLVGKDENGRRDIIDKLSGLLYGENPVSVSVQSKILDGETLAFDFQTDAEQMYLLAKVDIAWRYSLREMIPFVLQDGDYDSLNVDGSLDLYNPETGEGVLTDNYLRDRAQALAAYIQYWNQKEQDGVLSYDFSVPFTDIQISIPFLAQWNDLVIYDEAFGEGQQLIKDGWGASEPNYLRFGDTGADTLSGGSKDDRLYGLEGNDSLYGYGGNDYIEGGSGDDFLYGGDDDDYLAGMSGDDHLYGGG